MKTFNYGLLCGKKEGNKEIIKLEPFLYYHLYAKRIHVCIL